MADADGGCRWRMPMADAMLRCDALTRRDACLALSCGVRRKQHVGLKGYVLAGFFRQLRPGALPNLLALNLRHNPYGDEGLLGLCEALLKPIYAMPNLETLDLSNDTDEERFAAASFAKISSAPDAQSANRPTSVVGHSSASHHLPGAAGAQPQQQQQSSSSRPPQQSLFAPPSHVPDSNSPPTASPAAVPARGFWFQQAEQPKAVPSSTVNDLSTPRSDADTLEATRQEKVMRRRPSVEQREEVARAKESRRPSDMGTLTDAPSGQTPPLGGSYGSEVTDVGVAALANVMNADGLRSCKQLFLYGNPEIGSAGLTALTKALKRGSCASLSTIYLEGHNGSVRDEMALARVRATRTHAHTRTCRPLGSAATLRMCRPAAHAPARCPAHTCPAHTGAQGGAAGGEADSAGHSP